MRRSRRSKARDDADLGGDEDATAVGADRQPGGRRERRGRPAAAVGAAVGDAPAEAERPVARAGEAGERAAAQRRHVDVAPARGDRDRVRSRERVARRPDAAEGAAVGDAAREPQRAVGAALEVRDAGAVGRGDVDVLAVRARPRPRSLPPACPSAGPRSRGARRWRCRRRRSARRARAREARERAAEAGGDVDVSPTRADRHAGRPRQRGRRRARRSSAARLRRAGTRAAAPAP